LVWVVAVAVAAWLVGWRGVSWRGLAAVSVLLGLYLYLRLDYLGVGVPTLVERSTGLGFARLEPDEVIARFGGSPWLFYLHNVVVSAVGVLLSDPRSATWVMTARLVDQGLVPVVLVSFASALTATGVLTWAAVASGRDWLARRFDDDGRMLLVFGAVLAASAVVSYVYVKDEVMGTAGVFYALAVYAATRRALAVFGRAPRPPLATLAFCACLMLAGSTWAVRVAGLHYQVVYMGFTVQNDWAGVDRWLVDQGVAVDNPSSRRLLFRLQQEAINRPVLNQYFMPGWGERWFR
jgi:hypothetical protein